MIKHKITIKKTTTNLGECPIMGTKSEPFEVEAYQYPCSRSQAVNDFYLIYPYEDYIEVQKGDYVIQL